MSDFNIEKVINKLKKKRSAYVSEADFQFEMSWAIKEIYKNKVEVYCEYVPYFDQTMHIDILAKMGNEWIPIELKYKTAEAKVKIGDIVDYQLKEQGAKDCACYDYLKDISRIEEIKKQLKRKRTIVYKEGYAIFLTNQKNYKDEPRSGAMYKNFSIHENRSITKEDKLFWDGNPSAGTTAKREDDIVLNNEYEFKWNNYNNNFYILINKID